MRLTALTLLLVHTPLALSAVTLPAAIDHSAVVIIPDSGVSSALKKFAPLLFIESGCFPYPAVDQLGHPSLGLPPSGFSYSGCVGSPGQIYARDGVVGKQYAFMYSWYFPKDVYQDVGYETGQQSVWQSIVVFVNNLSDARPASIAYSSGTEYRMTTDFETKGSRPLIGKRYNELFTVLEYGSFTREQALIQWLDMSALVRRTLDFYIFGPAGNQQCPFNDAHFLPNLDRAAAAKSGRGI